MSVSQAHHQGKSQHTTRQVPSYHQGKYQHTTKVNPSSEFMKIDHKVVIWQRDNQWQLVPALIYHIVKVIKVTGEI